MDLLVIRHGIAEDRGLFAETGRPDSERPLTERGVARMAEIALGLRALVPELDVLATSPFVRARQTADLVSEAYDGITVTQTPALAHGADPGDFLAWLLEHPAAGTVAAVGHEPDLSELVGWLVTGAAESFLGLKKGGACLLRFSAPAAAGSADLRWLVQPKMLRVLSATP